MPRQHAVPTVVLLCLVLTEVRCSVGTVNLSRFLRKGLSFDMNDTPEASCALALLPPNFQPGDHDSYSPRLYVFGKTVWLNEFLRRFPKVASVYLFDGSAAWEFADFVLTGMLPSSSVALVLDQSEQLLHIPYRVRVLYWEASVADTQLESEVRSLNARYYPPGACHRFVRIMVTTHPAGATHVFSLHLACDMFKSPAATLEPLGTWSPGTGWSTPTSAIFPEACVSWRPPPDGQPLTAVMMSVQDEVHGDLQEQPFKLGEGYNVLRVLRNSYGPAFEFKFNVTRNPYYPLRAADTCRLDVVACSISSNPGFKITVALHSQLSVFAWGLHDLIFVVPAGAGKPYHALHSITAEFAPAVWSAVGASTLVVAACFYLTRGQQSFQNVFLLTFAPLLGQPLSFQSVRTRTILGGWMLTCFVVVAGYQGKLLSFLRNPLRNREINSWQDWLESDLKLINQGPYGVLETEYLSLIGADGLTSDRFRFGFSYWDMLSITANGKKTSFFSDKADFDMVFNYVPKDVTNNLHVFPMAAGYSLSSCFVTTNGSPIEKPLRKLLGRLRAAGIHDKYRTIVHRTTNVTTEGKPITKYNLQPVMMVYLTGNLVALISFFLELFT
ncbi:Ionotropic receptor 267 [Frankliniella occidentalis]|uniref:Uncharacterized protein LOC127752160 n=1 Tax=Frankliniella occidentalis TaxID=133901 RepID=A0A9C6XCF7_FRAOC|nr:uncharacterized protein LOC127752160 [Frankliniella occidentalis]KAE8736645.1 Ionotropic receptor 267 [Frankliniella occidentalis]